MEDDLSNVMLEKWHHCVDHKGKKNMWQLDNCIGRLIINMNSGNVEGIESLPDNESVWIIIGVLFIVNSHVLLIVFNSV